MAVQPVKKKTLLLTDSILVVQNVILDWAGIEQPIK